MVWEAAVAPCRAARPGDDTHLPRAAHARGLCAPSGRQSGRHSCHPWRMRLAAHHVTAAAWPPPACQRAAYVCMGGWRGCMQRRQGRRRMGVDARCCCCARTLQRMQRCVAPLPVQQHGVLASGPRGAVAGELAHCGGVHPACIHPSSRTSWPAHAARCKGVRDSLSRALTSAPIAISSTMRSVSPVLAAVCMSDMFVQFVNTG